MKTRTKQLISGILAGVLILGNLPVQTFAAEEPAFCEHHPVHENCGYVEAAEGAACTHVHSDACYEAVTACIHVHEDCSYAAAVPGTDCTHLHDESCGYAEAAEDAPAADCTHIHDETCGFSQGTEEVPCDHVCTEESGCVTTQTACMHSHDEACGYAQAVEGQPCTFQCQECAEEEEILCNGAEDCPAETHLEDCAKLLAEEKALADQTAADGVSALIDTLPALEDLKVKDRPSQQEDYNQVQAAYEAYNALTYDQKALLPQAKALFQSYFDYFNAQTAEDDADSVITGTCEENLTWTLDAEGVLTISGTGEMEHFYPYTQPWLSECSSIQSVVITEGVKRIGNNAFTDCINLVSVTIPLSVEFIGYNAFSNCYALTEIYYAGNYSQWDALYTDYYGEIGITVHRTPAGSCGENASWAFDSSTGTLTISGQGEVMEYVYYRDDLPWYDFISSVKHVVVEEGITNLGYGVFSDHTALQTVSLPETLKEIPENAFAGCAALTGIKIPAGVTEVMGGAFFECTSLKTVTLPEALISIGSGAFEGCSALTNIVIPNGTVAINEYAFWKCTGLKTVTIPGTVTDMYISSFSACTALRDIYYGSSKTVWESLVGTGNEPYASANVHFTPGGICGDDLTWSFNESTGVLTISGKGDMYDYDYWTYDYHGPWYDYTDKIKSVVVKSGVTSIGTHAFGAYSYEDAPYSALESVSLPSTVTKIGEYAFHECSALSSITIPGKVTEIGRNAFAGCSSLTAVTLPDSVTSIGSGIFLGCSALGSVTLSDNLTEIPQNAFCGCSQLRSITIPAGVTEIGSYAFEDNEKLTTVKLPAGLKTIGSYAFQLCPRLSSISIPSTVTAIGEYAFSDCKAITKLTIPAGLTAIQPGTFYGCGFTQITIPASVTSIGNSAFACTALTSVTVPNTVKTLENAVFSSCQVLTSAVLPSGLTKIPQGLFSGCYKLTDVTIPSGVTEIGSYAFSNCGFTGITLPAKLTEIGESAFHACDSIEKIVIPKNVELIDYTAFSYCQNLKVIQFQGNAPEISPDSFREVTAGVVYPRNNSTWTSSVRQNYGGTLTWSTAYPLSVLPRISDGKPRLTWGKVTGATKYYVYRSTRANGGFTKIYTTTGTSMTNTSAVFGTTYYYKVTTVFSDGTTATSNVVSCNCVLPAPQITVTKNSNGCPVIRWDAIDGAVVYEVHRRNDNNWYSYTTQQTSFVDTDAEAGVTYQYQVLAYPSEGYDFRSQFPEPVTFTVPLPQPAITVSNVASTGKIKVSWSAIPHAQKYQVYRATSKTGTYKLLSTVTGTSLTNTSTTAGTTYYYKVRAIHADSSGNSPFSSIVSRTCDLPRPDVTVSNVASSGKIKLAWDAIEGAVKYQIYRATSKTGTYKLLSTVTGTSLTNTSTTAGTLYYYKVKAIHSNSAANSAYSAVDSRTCDLPRPVVTLSRNSKGQPVIQWEKIEGAVKYEVYRSTSTNGTYTKLITTSGTKITNSSAVSGQTYYYKVKALCDNTAGNSAYSSVKSITAG